MDKETLSNYGWIVIAVLVLSVMIALATPFGGYIKDAVWSTTEGLFDTSEKALNIIGVSTTPTQNTVVLKKDPNYTSPNIFNYKTCEQGQLNKTTGAFNSGSNWLWVTSDFMSVTPNTQYKNMGCSTNVWAVCFYDENKNFIETATNTNGNYTTSETSPSNAKYMRVHFYFGTGATEETAMNKLKTAMILPYEYSLLCTDGVYIPYEGDVIGLPATFNSTYSNSSTFSGKTLAVIGDSISTWENHNAAELVITEADVGKTLSAYISPYDVTDGLTINGYTFTEADAKKELTITPSADDVGKVVGRALTYYRETQTRPWWYWLCDELDMNCNNASYSGEQITSTSPNSPYYYSSAWHQSTIRKCGTRIEGTMNRTAPDYVIIARGMNDYSHSPGSVITDSSYAEIVASNITTDYISTNVYGFKEGIVLTIQQLQKTYPNTKIFLSTIPPTERTPSNGCTLEEYNQAIIEAGEYFNIPVIDFNGALSPMWETSDGTHPNPTYQYYMFDAALKTLCENQ